MSDAPPQSDPSPHLDPEVGSSRVATPPKPTGSDRRSSDDARPTGRILEGDDTDPPGPSGTGADAIRSPILVIDITDEAVAANTNVPPLPGTETTVLDESDRLGPVVVVDDKSAAVGDDPADTEGRSTAVLSWTASQVEPSLDHGGRGADPTDPEPGSTTGPGPLEFGGPSAAPSLALSPTEPESRTQRLLNGPSTLDLPVGPAIRNLLPDPAERSTPFYLRQRTWVAVGSVVVLALLPRVFSDPTFGFGSREADFEVIEREQPAEPPASTVGIGRVGEEPDAWLLSTTPKPATTIPSVARGRRRTPTTVPTEAGVDPSAPVDQEQTPAGPTAPPICPPGVPPEAGCQLVTSVPVDTVPALPTTLPPIPPTSAPTTVPPATPTPTTAPQTTPTPAPTARPTTTRPTTAPTTRPTTQPPTTETQPTTEPTTEAPTTTAPPTTDDEPDDDV